MRPQAALWHVRGPKRWALLALAGTIAWSVWWISLPFRVDAQTPVAVGIHKVQGAAWRPERGEPLFIAVLGSDTRVGPPTGGGGRCDAIHIVAINPQAKAGTILNIPRDSYIGGQKINANCVGGAERMVGALKSLSGLPIHYYAITEFSNFVKLFDDLGGLEINVPYDMKDSPSGADFRPGPLLMTGGQVLSFSRNRKHAPGGDFGRTENQGRVILATLAKFRKEMADPHRLFDYIKLARRHTATTVPVAEMIKLALIARDIDPANVANKNIPGGTGSAGAASVVFLSPGDIFARVRDDAIL